MKNCIPKTRPRFGMRNRVLPTVALACLVLGHSFAWGQATADSKDQAQSASASEAGTLQQITITAERRESTVQKTAISMTAISGAQLTQRGLDSIEDVALEVPGISMRSSGPGETEYEMRGLSSSGGSSATVGLYLNDIPLTPPANSFNGKATVDPNLFDLNRVEVLRGPQGTLYGSGDMGGTIRLVTEAPKLNNFEAGAETTLSDTDGGGLNWGVNGMLNLPLAAPTLALRLVATDQYTDGWIDRIVLNPFPIGPGGDCGYGSCTRGDVLSAPVAASFPRSNWERLSGGRGSLLFEPSDTLTIDLFAMYQGITMGGFNQADVPPGVDYLAHYQPFNIPEPFEDTFRVDSATINYTFDSAKLTSATGWWTRDSYWSGDNAETMQSLLAVALDFPTLVPTTYSEDDHSQQFSQELRLASVGSGPWQWLLGGFYENFESTDEQYVANLAYAPLSLGGAAANPLGILATGNNPYRVKQYAIFGQSSYNLTSALKATVGLRWYRYDTLLNTDVSGVFTDSGNASHLYGRTSIGASGLNPQFTLSYQPNDSLNLYTTASRGFRPGGVNIPIPSFCGPTPETYGTDHLWNYEVGEKARPAGGRFMINSDFYYIVWDNVQQYLDLPACGIPYTTNAGTAISYGPELELAGQLIPDVYASFSGAYNNATIHSVSAGAQGLVIGVGAPIESGTPLENVPRYTAQFLLHYSHSFTDEYRMLGNFSVSRVGPTHDVSYYYYELPAYTLLNSRIGLARGPLTAYLFVNNMTDKHAELTVDNYAYSVATPSFVRASVNQPRTIGLDLQYQY